jgi:hypothetical protein
MVGFALLVPLACMAISFYFVRSLLSLSLSLSFFLSFFLFFSPLLSYSTFSRSAMARRE